MDNINALNTKYNTDKFNLGYIEHIYSQIFDESIINKTKNLLEIGVKDGQSILLWSEIFTNSNIYATDINFCPFIEKNDRIHQLIGDAYTQNFSNNFDDLSLDIIIDDGPHTLDSFLSLVDLYLPKLANNGIMVIEDIIKTTWTPVIIDKITKSNIKTKYKIFHMKNKQKTQLLLDRWKNGLDVIVIERI